MAVFDDDVPVIGSVIVHFQDGREAVGVNDLYHSYYQPAEETYAS